MPLYSSCFWLLQFTWFLFGVYSSPLFSWCTSIKMPQTDLQGLPSPSVSPCGKSIFSQTSFSFLPGVYSNNISRRPRRWPSRDALAQAQPFLLELCQWQPTHSCLLCQMVEWKVLLSPAPSLSNSVPSFCVALLLSYVPQDTHQVCCISRHPTGKEFSSHSFSIRMGILLHKKLPRRLSGKESSCQCRRHRRLEVWSLGREDPLEKEMATHASILAWRIPWTE